MIPRELNPTATTATALPLPTTACHCLLLPCYCPATALLLPCYCPDTALLLPCCCPATATATLPLPYRPYRPYCPYRSSVQPASDCPSHYYPSSQYPAAATFFSTTAAPPINLNIAVTTLYTAAFALTATAPAFAV